MARGARQRAAPSTSDEAQDLNGALDFKVARGLTLSLSGTYGTREGTKPLGFGTYIRRQALTGVPGTGAGQFWRETVESRGNELAEPLDHAVTEGGVTLTWARKGYSIAAGWSGSYFRNNTSALYFDNPFEVRQASSATIFNRTGDGAGPATTPSAGSLPAPRCSSGPTTTTTVSSRTPRSSWAAALVSPASSPARR
jgi:hypothetical protein